MQPGAKGTDGPTAGSAVHPEPSLWPLHPFCGVVLFWNPMFPGFAGCIPPYLKGGMG